MPTVVQDDGSGTLDIDGRSRRVTWERTPELGGQGKNRLPHQQPALTLHDSGEELSLTGRFYVWLAADHPVAGLHHQLQQAELPFSVDWSNGSLARLVASPDALFHAPRVVQALRAVDGVQRVQPEWRHHPVRHVSALYPWQWDLHGVVHPPTTGRTGAGLNLTAARGLSHGSKDIVIAVIDDGFDLKHAAFDGVNIHPEALNLIPDQPATNVSPGPPDFHGTPTAGVAVAGPKSETRGIAPGCTLLPIRIDLHSASGSLDPDQLLEALKHAEKHADVVLCAFNNQACTVNLVSPPVQQQLEAMTAPGAGRRGKGVFVIFPTGNDGVPIALDAKENANGVVLYSNKKKGLCTIPAGLPVTGNFCSVPGVVGVGGTTSEYRRAAFSSVGVGIDFVAPTNNGHSIAYNGQHTEQGAPHYNRFYSGTWPIAPANRAGFGGDTPGRMLDHPFGTGTCEYQYTRWGGTSHCVPLLGGVVALMWSVDPHLTSAEVHSILVRTARRDLDTHAYVPADPNLNGLGPYFQDGWSPWFGHGLIDADAALWAAFQRKPKADRPQWGGC